MPTPPVTTKAPVVVDVDGVIEVAVNDPAVNVPTPIIFTTPSMSPPLPDAEKLVAVNVPPTYSPPPIPTPPATCNAPVVVLLVGVVFVITNVVVVPVVAPPAAA